MQNEVIIDGVNVAECNAFLKEYEFPNNLKGGYYTEKNLCECGIQGTEAYPFFCKDNPDCYFKQLQRAKAELEQYKNDIASGVGCIQCKKELENCALKSELEQYKKSTQATYDYLEIERKRLVFETKTLKAENEKLKKELDNFRRVD